MKNEFQAANGINDTAPNAHSAATYTSEPTNKPGTRYPVTFYTDSVRAVPSFDNAVSFLKNARDAYHECAKLEEEAATFSGVNVLGKSFPEAAAAILEKAIDEKEFCTVDIMQAFGAVVELIRDGETITPEQAGELAQMIKNFWYSNTGRQ